MSFNYEGRRFRASLPIASISVNKCNVVFTDQTSRQKLHFSDNLQTRKFVAWLVSLARNESNHS